MVKETETKDLVRVREEWQPLGILKVNVNLTSACRMGQPLDTE